MNQPSLNASPILKVTIFAVAQGKVLVFDHPLAGTQFPAGTVDFGESPADAAVRELAEETGVHVSKIEFLGTSLTCREDDLAYTAQGIVADDGLKIPPGYRVHVLSSDGESVRFARRESDHSCSPPILLRESTGLTSSLSLTRSIERHFYRTNVEIAPPWSWEGDDGYVWRCHFVEVRQVRAFGEQQGWLDHYASRLVQDLE